MVLEHLNTQLEALSEEEKGAVVAFLRAMIGGLTEAVNAPQA